MNGATPIDTYGCPEYFIDSSSIEVMGTNIRLSFGIRRGEQIQGVFSMVMTADFACACSQVCHQVSREAAFQVLRLGDFKVIAH